MNLLIKLIFSIKVFRPKKSGFIIMGRHFEDWVDFWSKFIGSFQPLPVPTAAPPPLPKHPKLYDYGEPSDSIIHKREFGNLKIHRGNEDDEY